MLLLLSCSFDYDDDVSANITALAFLAKFAYTVAYTRNIY